MVLIKKIVKILFLTYRIMKIKLTLTGKKNYLVLFILVMFILCIPFMSNMHSGTILLIQK